MSKVIHMGVFPSVGQFALAGTFGPGGPPQPCTPGDDPTYDGNYPFEFDLPTAMFLYWVVQSWQLTGTLDWEDHDGATGSFIYNQPIAGTASFEADLVCGEQVWVDNFGIVGRDRFNMFDAPITDSFAYGPNIHRALGNMYRPRVYFNDDLGIPDSKISTNPNEGTFIGGAMDMYIQGSLLQSVPIYCDTTTFVLMSGTLNLAPSEYWPYDPGDGEGPIWNASTGALLRPEALSASYWINN